MVLSHKRGRTKGCITHVVARRARVRVCRPQRDRAPVTHQPPPLRLHCVTCSHGEAGRRGGGCIYAAPLAFEAPEFASDGLESNCYVPGSALFAPWLRAPETGEWNTQDYSTQGPRQEHHGALCLRCGAPMVLRRGWERGKDACFSLQHLSPRGPRSLRTEPHPGSRDQDQLYCHILLTGSPRPYSPDACGTAVPNSMYCSLNTRPWPSVSSRGGSGGCV